MNLKASANKSNNPDREVRQEAKTKAASQRPNRYALLQPGYGRSRPARCTTGSVSDTCLVQEVVPSVTLPLLRYAGCAIMADVQVRCGCQRLVSQAAVAPAQDVGAIKAAKARGTVIPLPEKSVQTDNTGHWPVFSKKKGQCTLSGCKGTMRVMCMKCSTYLCFTSTSNCFCHQ